MNLIDQAELDLEFTLEDKDNGFGVELKLYDESENEYPVIARVNDIGFFIDPSTGIGVKGRTVEASIRISSLNNLSNGDPPDSSWTAKYTDKKGEIWLMGISTAPMVDRVIGVYLITLEAMKDDTETEN